MRRRDFIMVVAGSAATWPLASSAQQPERMRRVGFLGGLSDADSEGRARFAVFRQALQQLGWTEGRNIRYDFRARDSGGLEFVRRYVAELVAFAPDVILVNGTQNLESLQQATRSIPIVFVNIADPVGAGYVESLARPGGNLTGFTSYEYGLSAKWVELLKEIAPRVTRAGVLRDSGISSGIGLWAVMQGAASTLGVELKPIGLREVPEIERGIAAFARGPDSGLIVLPGSLTIVNRGSISALTARYRLPAVYAYRFFVDAGGLISYGPNVYDAFRRAAGYVDRILKGTKATDLPVQNPTKYELVINNKTAKGLGLTVPPTLLARADEVIE